MASQTIQSVNLMNELGNEFVKAHEKAKNVKVDPGNMLPDGVKGIAKLRDIGFRKISKGANVGKVMFYADATIMEPETHDGMSAVNTSSIILDCNRCPASPMNGIPMSSSLCPGASPMNNTSHGMLPLNSTVLFLVL